MITYIKDPLDVTKLVSTKHVLDDKKVAEYFIAQSKDGKIIHYGELTEGLQMETGQPIVTTYKDKKVWTAALALLNIEGVGYYAAKMG